MRQATWIGHSPRRDYSCHQVSSAQKISLIADFRNKVSRRLIDRCAYIVPQTPLQATRTGKQLIAIPNHEAYAARTVPALWPVDAQIIALVAADSAILRCR